MTTAPHVLDWSFLPATPLYGSSGLQGAFENKAFTTPENTIGWQLSPTPYPLSAKLVKQLHQFGDVLFAYLKAVDLLYKASQNPETQRLNSIPEWVGSLYTQGKPSALLNFSAMNRFKSQLPLVIRPDLLLQDDGWSLCEIDAVPGGLGFLSALNRFYTQNGFPVLEAEEGLSQAFLNMLKALTPEIENPVIAIVLSDEAIDYRTEMKALVETLRAGDENNAPYPDIVLLHPAELALNHDRLVYADPVSGQDIPIDTVYRFFELFDLPNIPNIELIQFAIKKNRVKCTAPFKPHLEEKLSLALLHHPMLQSFWRSTMGDSAFQQLKACVPESWILDPAPLPSQAVIPGLQPAGQPLQSFAALKTLSQKQRQLVIKASGFSPVGWGSKSVTIGHDHSAENWAKKLDEALDSFGVTPYLLQNFEPASVVPVNRLTTADGQYETFNARIRLCPYYFVTGTAVKLAGVLATACPADKKIIHGMKDAVMMPCMIAPG